MPTKLALLEAMLFTTTEPLTADRIRKKLRLRKEEDIINLINELRKRYEGEDSGIKLSESGGYRLVVKGDYVESVSDLTPHADMSRGLLRVLAIIAYHEPVKQADIVKVVGNRTYEYVKLLEERGLVTSERKSRTKMLVTTPHFEEYFGAQKQKIKKYLAEINREEQTKEKEYKAEKGEQKPESIAAEEKKEHKPTSETGGQGVQ